MGTPPHPPPHPRQCSNHRCSISNASHFLMLCTSFSLCHHFLEKKQHPERMFVMTQGVLSQGLCHIIEEELLTLCHWECTFWASGLTDVVVWALGRAIKAAGRPACVQLGLVHHAVMSRRITTGTHICVNVVIYYCDLVHTIFYVLIL